MIIVHSHQGMNIMANFHSLTYHGRTRDVCEWVLMTYANRPDYADNASVQEWVEHSKAFLDALEEDERLDKALEAKFGKETR